MSKSSPKKEAAAEAPAVAAAPEAAAAAAAAAPVDGRVKPAPYKKNGKLIRPRGKRGGVKHHKKAADAGGDEDKGKGKKAGGAKASGEKKAKSSASEPTEHSVKIAAFHTLLKRIAQAKEGSKEKKKLEKQLEEEHGGLGAYQQESLKGKDRLHAGETGKWLAEQLGDKWAAHQEQHGKRKLRVLDVGGLSGTAYAKFGFVEPTYIDLNPGAENVVQADFHHYPPPATAEEKFDVVGLSLVLNFEGDLFKRGDMLVRAHHFLHPHGWLYLVLPLACVANSRYLDHDRLRDLLASAGWDVELQADSKRLTRWLCRRKTPEAKAKWDGEEFKKVEVRSGLSSNNFCIRLGRPQKS